MSSPRHNFAWHVARTPVSRKAAARKQHRAARPVPPVRSAWESEAAALLLMSRCVTCAVPSPWASHFWRIAEFSVRLAGGRGARTVRGMCPPRLPVLGRGEGAVPHPTKAFALLLWLRVSLHTELCGTVGEERGASARRSCAASSPRMRMERARPHTPGRLLLAPRATPRLGNAEARRLSPP